MFAICSTPRSRQMKQVPDSLLAFQHMFPDDDACAAWDRNAWPGGFCPECVTTRDGHCAARPTPSRCRLPPALGHGRNDPAWQQTAPHRLVLIYRPIPTRCNSRNSSVSARAWLLAHKLRTAMVDPVRNPLSGLVRSTRPAFPSGPGTIPLPVGRAAATTGC